MEPTRTLRYADHADGVIDLHEPAGSPSALVVLLHGGFWRATYDRTHTRPMAGALADQGFLVATPEYRRVGAAGGWPMTCDDVADALRSLSSLGFGERTVLTGHSAGGHLAMWALAALPDVRWDGVVPLAPVCDLREAIRRGLGNDATRAFLDGADPMVCDPMTAYDALAPTIPVEIVHPVDDDTVPIDLSRGFVTRHPWVGLTEVPGGHMDAIDPQSEAWPVVLQRLRGLDP